VTSHATELRYDPDPAVWLVGPDENRPPEVWVPGAVEAVVSDFSVTEKETEQYVERVLETFARSAGPPLTERLLRWRNINDDPFVTFLGMIEREHWSDDDLDAYLRSEEEAPVEPPVVEDVEAPGGRSIRRGIAYTSHPDGVVVGVRYVIENGVPDLLAVMQTATRRPGQLIEALDDFDDLARTVHVVASAA